MERKTENSGNQKQILSATEISNNVTYQLGTGIGFHVSSDENDFQYDSIHSKNNRVAGGGSVSTLELGNILFPTHDGQTEKFHGAI